MTLVFFIRISILNVFYYSLTGLLSRGQQEVGEAQHRVEQRLATNSRQNFSGFYIVQIILLSITFKT